MLKKQQLGLLSLKLYRSPNKREKVNQCRIAHKENHSLFVLGLPEYLHHYGKSDSDINVKYKIAEISLFKLSFC